ncbi:MAG: hypothetical protein ACI4KF_06570 [Huintestinicola sp.]
MHKLIHADKKRIAQSYKRLLFLLNLPSAAVGLSLVIIVNVVLRDADVPITIYRVLFYALYAAVVISFIATLTVSVAETLSLRGHGSDTYIEIFDSEMIVSRYSGTGLDNGKLCSYKDLWVIDLNDIENVTCTRNKMIITSKARYFYGKSEWLGYEQGENGDPDFDFWWYNENGGQIIQKVEFKDVYTYSDRIAQRIIFCAEKYKQKQLRRQEFRQRMLEIAGRTKKAGQGLEPRYKRSERVFRSGTIGRNF